MFWKPLRHHSHVPSPWLKGTSTRSPFFHRVTSGPTSSTTPQNSCPSTHGGWSVMPTHDQSPLQTCQSLRQTPFASTRMIAPFGGHCGSGMSRTTSGWRMASTTAARMVVLLPLKRWLRGAYTRRSRRVNTLRRKAPRMAKSRALEERLAALGGLRREPVTDETIATLRQALRHKVSHVVAKAAQVSGELGLRVLVGDLAAAFDRFLANPVKADPGCRAKVEIARALHEMGEDTGAVFLRGIRHRQLEPVFGGREDTAPELRAMCGLGLVRVGHPDAMVELADLLADPEVAARIGAARALAYAGEPSGEPLLRLKALAGDPDAGVVSESLGALLSLAPSRSLDFVARFLRHRDPVVEEAAALALGASRLRDALPVLRGWWEATPEV